VVGKSAHSEALRVKPTRGAGSGQQSIDLDPAKIHGSREQAVIPGASGNPGSKQ